MEQRGSLVCVGVGMSLGAHISPIAKTHIKQADCVFAAASDGLFELWLSDIHPNVISLQQFYQPGKSRKSTYQEMVDAILEPVRNHQKVVAAFYGHPGVFVNPSHKAIAIAKEEGFETKMVPGISAADCLYADLGIDPGKYGCQHFEASQFMFYKRVIDTSAYLVLWQPMFAGDKSHTRLEPSTKHLAVLKTLLLQHYPDDHPVIVYEAASNALDSIREEKIELNSLEFTNLTMRSTLVIQPAKSLEKNVDVIDSLSRLDTVRVL